MSTDSIDIRVRLQGGRVAAVEARGVASAVDSIGDAGTRTGGKLERLRTRVAGFAGGMSRLGEASRTGAYALGAFGAAAAVALTKMGADYNATLDSQRVAFTTFMRSGAKAEAFMKELQQLALDSPVLDPKSTGQAARTMMAFGIATKDVLPYVKAVGDMAAASGKSVQEVMPDAARAIGQVASKGKLQTEELNQLAESVGLSRDRIRKALNMTRDEFEKSFTPGNNISSAKALPAIRKAMEAQSKGAADLLAKTTQGRVDRLKEVVARGMGQLTRPLYDSVGKFAGGLADSLQSVNFTKVSKDVGKFLTAAFAKGRKFVEGFMEAIRPAAPFFQNVLGPLLKGFAIGVLGSVIGATKVLVPVLKALMIALGWIGEKARPLRGVFQGLGTVLGFFFGGPVLKGIGLLGKFGGVFRVVGVAARALAVPLRIVGGTLGLIGKAAGRMVGVFASAIGKVKGFVVDGLLGFLAKLPAKVGNLGLKAAEAMAKGIAKIPELVRRAFAGGLGFAGNIGRALADWLNRTTPLGDKIDLPGPLPSFRLPALAMGGVLTNPGQVLVGEQGPEVLTLPKAARVDPLPKRGPLAPVAASSFGGAQVIQLVVDGRVLAESTARHADAASNRR